MAFSDAQKRALIGVLLLLTFCLTILKCSESFYTTRESLLLSVINDNDFHSVPHVIQIEKTWTYKCVNERCVRLHYSDINEERTPFLTCSMLCGSQNIWPKPMESIVSKNASSFDLKDVQHKIEASVGNVENLLESAFSIFLNEIKQFQDISEGNITSDSHNNNTEALLNSGNATTSEERNSTSINIIINVTTPADVLLSLDTNECYDLIISSENQAISIRISANSFFGARHGLSTLEQLIWYCDASETLKIINNAEITDCPKFAYRGLLLDTSRHYFSVDAIKRTLVGMSHSKLNRFHWHITDSQSFPFVSEHYPELAEYGAYSSKEIYTHDDIREIVDFARVRGIQVIPEIDAPAHSGNGWQWGPSKGLGELSLCINQQPWKRYCGEPPCGQLNPKNNNTYTILQKLYQELVELTSPTDYFHLGGDEVNLQCWSQHFNDLDLQSLWCDFILEAHDQLKTANNNQQIKLTSVWSSGLTKTSCLSPKNFAVQLWGGSQWPENIQHLNAGYNVVFSHVDAWYLDCGFGSWRATGDAACSPYRNWQTVYKHRPWRTMNLNPKQMKQVLGGEACLWTEQVNENILDARLWPRASALGERLWTDPDIESRSVIPNETFRRMTILRNRLVELGIKAEPIFPKYCAQNQDECV